MTSMDQIIRAAAVIILAERARPLMSAEGFLDMQGLCGEERQEVMVILADYDMAYLRTVQRPAWDENWSLDNQTMKAFVWEEK